MKVCISLRDTASQDLRSGNLRSEARWERQALEACTLNPEIEEIYTVGRHWEAGEQVSSKYKGPIATDVSKECVLLIQDWNTSIICSYRWKGIVVNIFHGPWLEEQEVVKSVRDAYQGKLVFSLGFEALYWTIRPDHPSAWEHLRKFLPEEDIVLLPVPGIPEMVEQDSFENTNLLWAWRIIFITQLEHPGIIWGLRQLQKNPQLKLEILTGTESWEIHKLIDGVASKIEGTTEENFWALPPVEPFRDVRDRVIIYPCMGWGEALGRYRQAKLHLSWSKYFGGPPLEAAMHGVPFVANSNTGAFRDCPGYLHAPNEGELFGLLDRLMSDRDFYRETADNYRRFASERYTFEAFNRNLNSLLQSRGLHG